MKLLPRLWWLLTWALKTWKPLFLLWLKAEGPCLWIAAASRSRCWRWPPRTKAAVEWFAPSSFGLLCRTVKLEASFASMSWILCRFYVASCHSSIVATSKFLTEAFSSDSGWWFASQILLLHQLSLWLDGVFISEPICCIEAVLWPDSSTTEWEWVLAAVDICGWTRSFQDLCSALQRFPISLQEESISDSIQDDTSMHPPIKICQVHLLTILHCNLEVCG